jgi:hypothetical protein
MVVLTLAVGKRRDGSILSWVATRSVAGIAEQEVNGLFKRMEEFCTSTA